MGKGRIAQAKRWLPLRVDLQDLKAPADALKMTNGRVSLVGDLDQLFQRLVFLPNKDVLC
jgi:hypothetical protein